MYDIKENKTLPKFSDRTIKIKQPSRVQIYRSEYLGQLNHPNRSTPKRYLIFCCRTTTEYLNIRLNQKLNEYSVGYCLTEEDIVIGAI